MASSSVRLTGALPANLIVEQNAGTFRRGAHLRCVRARTLLPASSGCDSRSAASGNGLGIA